MEPDGLPFLIDPDELLDECFDELVADALPQGVAGSAIWDDIWGKVKDTYRAVEQFLVFLWHPGRFSGWLTDQFLSVLTWIGDAGSDVIGQVWLQSRDVIGKVYGRAGTVWDWVDDRGSDVIGQVWTQSRDVIGKVYGRAGTVWDWVDDRGSDVIGQVWTQGRDVIGKIPGRTGTVYDWVWDRGGDAIEFTRNTGDFVIEQAGNAVMAGAQGIGEFFQAGLDRLFNSVFDPFADALRVKTGIPRKFFHGEYDSLDDLWDDFEDPLSPGSIVGVLFNMAGTMIALPGLLSEYGTVRNQGWLQDAAEAAGRTIPSFTELRDGLLRGEMTDLVHDQWLRWAGYSDENVELIKKLYWDIPTPSDLVRMAVREVFSPEIVSEFGLHDDFPPDFNYWAGQIGISPDWALAHWGAHWDLPSASQGFEMRHRDVIDDRQLDLLLRVQDVMPFWRDKLRAITYHPVTRVDIRRMYRAGVVDRDKVLRVYKDLGYTPEDAEFLTEYVTRDVGDIDMNLPRASIEKAYEDRLFTRDEAAYAIAGLGYPADQVEMFLDLVDLRVEGRLAALAEDIVETDFKRGAIGEGAVRSQLGLLGVPAERVDLLVNLWSRQAAVKDQDLTSAQLLRLFRAGVIGEPVLRGRLGRQGYNEQDVGYLIELSDPEEAPPEPASLTKADLRSAFRQGIMNEAQFRARLQEKGYRSADVDVLVAITRAA